MYSTTSLYLPFKIQCTLRKNALDVKLVYIFFTLNSIESITTVINLNLPS
jgi:hypothetical protein